MTWGVRRREPRFPRLRSGGRSATRRRYPPSRSEPSDSTRCVSSAREFQRHLTGPDHAGMMPLGFPMATATVHAPEVKGVALIVHSAWPKLVSLARTSGCVRGDVLLHCAKHHVRRTVLGLA